VSISPSEAEEALAAIEKIAQKTRRSIAGGGAYISLIITGLVWLVGFTATQFLTSPVVVWIWVVSAVLGSVAATLMGIQAGRRVRSPSASVTGKRIAIFWLLLILFSIAGIAVAQPADGKQLTMLIILFAMIGQMSMGLLLSFSVTWWTVPVVVLTLSGYFFFPEIYYLWMALLGGGTMIVLGLYIRYRW
jgi:hypothetical protein